MVIVIRSSERCLHKRSARSSHRLGFAALRLCWNMLESSWKVGNGERVYGAFVYTDEEVKVLSVPRSFANA
jgi:hypothetical protein